jgi:uncharacterized membrane protein (UPF0127 family)
MAEFVRVQNQRNSVEVATRCRVARDFSTRFFGLMGRSRFEAGEGILFPACKSVHMWFMRIPIDVVFLDGLTVSRVFAGARPWRLLPLSDLGATQVLEVPVGTVERCGIQKGDVLCLS